MANATTNGSGANSRAETMDAIIEEIEKTEVQTIDLRNR